MPIYRAPLVVFVCTLAAALGLAGYVRYEERLRLQNHVDGIAVYTAHWMEDRIERDLEAIGRMVERWVNNSGNDWAEWEADAQRYVEDFPELRAIEWADTSFRIRRVIPMEGNEAAQGIDLMQVLAEGDRLVESAGAGQVFTTSAIELVQGGTGFVAYHPLFLDGQFQGLIIAVFDVNRLVDLLAESDFGQETAITFGQNGRVFGVTSAGAIEEYGGQATTNLSGREWSILVNAKEALRHRFLTWTPALLLLIGTILSAALARAVHVSQKARRKQKESEAAQVTLGRELASANQRFEAAVVGASVGIWDWIDVSGRELWCSPVLNNLLGFEPGEIDTKGKFLRDIVHPDDRRLLLESIATHFNDGDPFRVEYRLRHASGEYRWFLGSGAAIRNTDGEPIRMVGSIMDIHELKQIQHDLERASRAKSNFLANMSHEIRTPMNGILGMTTVLLLSDLPETLRHNIEIIKASGDAMMEIVNDILDISKIEAERVVIDTHPFKVSDVLQRCAALYAARAESKGLALVVEGPDCWIADAVLGDDVRLMQILANLVSNAVKFTFQGQIKIRVAQEWLSKNEIRTRFEISDNGIGVPEGKMTEIFEPFSQADNSTTREYGGTGLGLSIAQNLAAMMGGEMGAISKLGEGSTFWFTVINEPTVSDQSNGDATHQSTITPRMTA